MIFIGINEGINGSVVVLDQGRVRFALQEERVNRIKEYVGFPHGALDLAMTRLALRPADIGRICLSNLDSPNFTREQFLAAYEDTADQPAAPPRGRPAEIGRKLMQEGPGWLLSRGLRRRSPAIPGGEPRPAVAGADPRMDAALARHGLDRVPVWRSHHHLNHAAAAYFGLRSDPDSPHLVLTLDGGGDDACGHVYRAEGGQLRLLGATPQGHSIGNLYSRITHLMGMKPHEHEYKLMGLAPYADPKYVRPVADMLRGYIGLDPDDPLSFRRNTAEPTHQLGLKLAQDLKRVRFDTIAGAIQLLCEELLVDWVGAAVRQTGIGKVVAAGGVFMNVKANKLIAELPEVEYFDVFPSCGDETLPFGAVWLNHALSDPRHGADIERAGMYLGPDARFDLDEARHRFASAVHFETLADPARRVAELIAGGEIVARCAGPMEFGARALGNRSILADPADYRVIARINRMIKQRDFWMPFAPALLAEDAEDYVRVPGSLPRPHLSPCMMHTFDTTDRRPEFEAGVHPYDGTARAQTVSASQNPGFHEIIAAFKALTGRAVVLNTSFNLHGSPIVLGAVDAIEVLLNSGLTHLVLEDFLVTKRA